MLAEPKRKQRWTLNPRGKQWSEDSNKFGQKMLEKMGWTSGKGLGANEQGITEHVRVSYKDDAAGIGFKKENLDKAWTEHQDGFNDFLQQLQKSQSVIVPQTEEVKSELNNKSLELKSKQSRARVHYQKFTRGKDVNKYSSKDIANIFGQKELNGEGDSKNNQSNDEVSFDPVGTRENTGGVITINGGNMADYFMRKGRDHSLTPKNKRQQESDSDSEPEYAGFGFAPTTREQGSHDSEESKETKNTCNYAFENPCLKLYSPENISDSGNRPKSSKKRKSSDDSELTLSNDPKKFKDDTVNKSACKNGFVNPALNLKCRDDEVCNGKEFEVSRAEFGVTNSALDLSDEVVDKKRVTFNDHVEYSTDVLKKKKGKARLDKFEIENKKIKKKKKREDSVNNPSPSGFVNEALEVEEVAEEVNDNEINERKSRKSKKRKGSRRSILETIVEIPEEDKETCEDEVGIKKLKLKENVTNDFIPEEQPSSKKSKKKKKKEKTEEETITGSKSDAEEIAETVTEIKARSENSECELQDEEHRENLSKEKKKKKNKNPERNVENHDDIISEIKTEVIDIDCVEKVVEKIEGTVKSKKKKKFNQDTHIIDSNTEVAYIKDEKEVSDKENANGGIDENTPKAKKPKKKKDKKSSDESTKDDNSMHIEAIKEESLKQETNTPTNTPSKTTNSETFNVSFSPWRGKAKLSRKLIKSIFHRNVDVHFPGSNIHEIKGYGAEGQ